MVFFFFLGSSLLVVEDELFGMCRWRFGYRPGSTAGEYPDDSGMTCRSPKVPATEASDKLAGGGRDDRSGSLRVWATI
jgi:hypothetical protein